LRRIHSSHNSKSKKVVGKIMLIVKMGAGFADPKPVAYLMENITQAKRLNKNSNDSNRK